MKPDVLSNLPFIEEMYKQYQAAPETVDESWHQYFSDIELNHDISFQKPDVALWPPYEPTVVYYPTVSLSAPSDLRIFHLIEAYRTYGHLLANVNPISLDQLNETRELNLQTLGFKSEELEKMFPTCGLMDKEQAKLREIIDVLKLIYCTRIGFEYMGLQNPEMEQWIQEHIESNHLHFDFTKDEKKIILRHLNKSELFESFLHTKFVGKKRFSLEGGETLIPIMEAVIEKGVGFGLDEMVIGMAHRGRLNLLCNIMGKSYSEVFSEFDDGYIPAKGTGDVKYHKGYISEIKSENGHKVKITLAPNPSHLESVDPVVEGQVRAKQFLLKDEVSREKVIPILIHGDASLAGQGVVYETMEMSRLKGYTTGGTVHIVINNHIGFTTIPEDARSTRYCTDIARTFSAPVFHVNAEDPEACVFATNLAMELRHQFHCDVFIDMNCYRKYGHNESDEPAFTQPLEYKIIRNKRNIREIYRDQLVEDGVLSKTDAENLEEQFKESLQVAIKEVKITQDEPKRQLPETEREGIHAAMFKPCHTAVSEDEIQTVAKHFSAIPEGLIIHPKIEQGVKDRLAMAIGQKPIDWGMGEYLAYATLLWEGHHVRLTGQDTCRGTFSHRHAIWMDQVHERAYIPLQHLKNGQGRFELYNSPLSEFACLGFEYGYSVAYPDALVIWEAQFGDFCNGAQITIDQYISTGEQKWGQESSVVLFLPHGYEGQGPEHSSGRMERFLTLCGEDNMQVVNPTTPAQLFHLLRRQVLKPMHKPLVVFTPKGLLRFPACVSQIEDLTKGTFQEVIDDPKALSKVRRLVFCSGRVYYDLISARDKSSIENMAIVRIEQLYPLNVDKVEAIMEKYRGFTECVWVQEEPRNMGAWTFIKGYLEELLPKGVQLRYIGRERSASPATGSHAWHNKEFASIISHVLAPAPGTSEMHFKG